MQLLSRRAQTVPAPDNRVVTTLQQAGCGVQIEPASPEIWVARYRRDGDYLYCLLNLSPQDRRCTLNLPDTVRRASLWLPETGDVRVTDAGRVEIQLPALGCALVWGEV